MKRKRNKKLIPSFCIILIIIINYKETKQTKNQINLDKKMGTRGYIVIKFRNKYYKIYNHFDSYAEYLGQKIVDILNKLKEEGKLEQDQAHECFAHLIAQIINLTNQHMEEGDAAHTLFIEWLYRIDLDNMRITMSGWGKCEEFDMLNIPDNWLESLNATGTIEEGEEEDK